MTIPRLQRTTYRDPFDGMKVRTGEATRGEAATDMEQYYQLLEQAHASTLHGWGIAAGLRVSATSDGTLLLVSTGVAVDVQGRHISLAQDGFAEVSPSDVQSSLEKVTAAGVTMATAGLSGEKYVTIAFRETFDTDGHTQHGFFRYNHTPLIQLHDVAGFADDGMRLVLARVTLGADGDLGKILAMSQGLRRGVQETVEAVRLQRASASGTADNLSAESVDAGTLRARLAGGVQLTVPAADAVVEVQRDDGGPFSAMVITAAEIAARRADGTPTIALRPDLGSLTAGEVGTPGIIRVYGGISTGVTLDGAAGDVSFSGTLRDLATGIGISHAELRGLEGRIKKIETYLANLSSSGPSEWLGFDIQDGGRQHKSASPGAFVTEVVTYIEDGHIKMAFGCKKLPPF